MQKVLEQTNYGNLAVMIAISNKSKQYGLLALKVFILSITFGYIYLKLTSDDALSFGDFLATVSAKNGWPIPFFFLLAALNWTFEILKWQLAVGVIQKIPFKEAAKQSLASLTVSLATPNRIGEFGAKAYFYPADKRKKIVLLNLYSGLSQMAVTGVLGLLGFIIIVNKYDIEFSTFKISLGILLIVIGCGFAYVFRNKSFYIKGFSISKVFSFMLNISKRIHIINMIYSILRYGFFSVLFFLLLKFFGVETSAQQAFPLIFAMYLLSSVVPSIFVLDIVIKGGISIWLFSLVGVPEWPILCTVMAMWILNYVAPGIWGSVYVLKHKNQ